MKKHNRPFRVSGVPVEKDGSIGQVVVKKTVLASSEREAERQSGLYLPICLIDPEESSLQKGKECQFIHRLKHLIRCVG